MKPLWLWQIIQTKVIERYFHAILFIMVCKVILTLTSGLKTLLWSMIRKYLKSNDESFTKQPNSEGKLAILFNDMFRSVRDFPKESNLEKNGKRKEILTWKGWVLPEFPGAKHLSSLTRQKSPVFLALSCDHTKDKGECACTHANDKTILFFNLPLDHS